MIENKLKESREEVKRLINQNAYLTVKVGDLQCNLYNIMQQDQNNDLKIWQKEWNDKYYKVCTENLEFKEKIEKSEKNSIIMQRRIKVLEDELDDRHGWKMEKIDE